MDKRRIGFSADERELPRSRARAFRVTMVVAIASVSTWCGGGGDPNQSIPAPAPSPPTYSATVIWTPPSLNTDGSALTTAASYRVDYGTSAADLSLSVVVPGGTSTGIAIDGLSAGTYYFAVTAVNSAGVASIRSNAVSRTLP